jgi:hypothetical protein
MSQLKVEGAMEDTKMREGGMQWLRDKNLSLFSLLQFFWSAFWYHQAK